jgi:hypothetical protein
VALALDVNDNEDYLSRRSLVEFRRRLATKDPEMKLVRAVFDTIRDSAIDKLGLSVTHQRLDSTHIISNIRLRGRLANLAKLGISIFCPPTFSVPQVCPPSSNGLSGVFVRQNAFSLYLKSP